MGPCVVERRVALECGDLSPLSLPERLVAQAEPRRAARRTDHALPQLQGVLLGDAPLNAVLPGRQVVPASKR